MSNQREEFTRRLERLIRRHREMAHGYTASIRGDGLIVIQPRRIQFQLPLRGFVLLMVFFIFFKGFMLASLGEAAYAERLDALSAGNLYERAGSFVMGIDPVSELLGRILSGVSGA